MVSKFKKPAGAESFIKNKKVNIDIDLHTNKDIDISDGIYTSIDTNTYPWQTHNKKSIKKKLFNLKINDYYLEVIRYLANPEEGVSMQNVIQEILIKELDKKVKEIEGK
jgi:hypothetical protein